MLTISYQKCHNPKAIMDNIAQYVQFKPGSVQVPKHYLGADIMRHTVHDGNQDIPMKQVWAMSPQEYIRRAIQEVECKLALDNSYLPKKVQTPLSNGYRPELNFSIELDSQRTNYYQGLIGVLRWIVELGRMDIIVPVTMLSRYLVSPREGHLQQVYHIFAYLKQFNRAMLVFDDSKPLHDPSEFHICNWTSHYPDSSKQIPPNAPEAIGNSIVMTCYVDADHAGCLDTRRSHTGIIIYVNKAPIVWFSKRQNTVESSTFGSEFITLTTAIDLVEALRYKLRMFGIPIDGASIILCDNEAVVLNSTHSESTIKRKHVSMAYHRCREAEAAGYVKIGSIKGMDNVADLLTKLLPGPQLRQLMEYIFHYKSAS
jgi:hypothetical protein